MQTTAHPTVTRLRDCQDSAKFWAENLGLYADEMASLADRYAIGAALISVVTGVAAWGTIAASTAWWGQAAVGVMAFTAAVVAIVPMTRGYGECAKAAAPLVTLYGNALGSLTDAIEGLEANPADPDAHALAQKAIDAFQEVKKAKDALRPLPRRLQEQRNAQKRPPAPPPVPIT